MENLSGCGASLQLAYQVERIESNYENFQQDFLEFIDIRPRRAATHNASGGAISTGG